MGKRAPLPKAHPKGEDFSGLADLPPLHRVDTFGGPLHVKWENDSEVTAQGGDPRHDPAKCSGGAQALLAHHEHAAGFGTAAVTWLELLAQ
jgi:hypothetical protein